MRADKLEFNISYSDSSYPESASKLRVFCYMKNGGYAFGDEFEDKYSATFDSNRTSKYSGYGTITIQLLDAEENLINSANVICKIIESNSTTPFVASPDFTKQSKFEVQAIVDNGKAQIEKATKEAKEEIDSWTDQSSRIAKNESNITDLQMFKANTGALHFNGGTLIVGASGTTDSMPSAFSWCRTIKISQEQWSKIENDIHFDTNSSSSAKGLSIFKTSNRLGFKYGDGTFASGDILLSADETNVIIDGKTHTLIIVGANERLRIYVDNILLRDVAVIGATAIPSTSDRYQIDRFTGQYSRIYNFNFDITSADAPYTIADYQQGKPIPPKAFEYLNQNVAEVPIDTTIKYSLSATPNNTISHWDRPATISVNGDAITWTATKADTSVYPKAIVYKFAKAFTGSGILKIDVGNVSKNGTLVTMRIIMFDITGAVSYPSDTGFGFDKGPLSLNIPYTNGLSAICIGTGSSWTAGDSFTIDYLKVEHNGTLLALEDYAIENGNSKFVFDYSGNNNDATITGDVKGDNDNRVQKLVDFITTLS